jgi:hypothetical protein
MVHWLTAPLDAFRNFSVADWRQLQRSPSP